MAAIIESFVRNTPFTPSTSADALYDRMAAVGSANLPIIHAPFDSADKEHVVRLGEALDFALVTGPGRVLDIGSGDGWPALIVAQFAEHVTGIDAAPNRVHACQENARRLGRANADFRHVPPGAPLPFDEASFDGITVCMALEQTPDPHATLRELHRVLKPGGKLRISYESLAYYANGRSSEAILGEIRTEDSAPRCGMIVFDRRLTDERVHHYGIQFDAPFAEIQEICRVSTPLIPIENLSAPVLEALRQRISLAENWTTQHPSCATLLAWLRDAGFSNAQPTRNGGQAAAQFFQRHPDSAHYSYAQTMEALRPLVRIACTMPAPAQSIPGTRDPWITATK